MADGPSIDNIELGPISVPVLHTLVLFNVQVSTSLQHSSYAVLQLFTRVDSCLGDFLDNLLLLSGGGEKTFRDNTKSGTPEHEQNNAFPTNIHRWALSAAQSAPR